LALYIWRGTKAKIFENSSKVGKSFKLIL